MRKLKAIVPTFAAWSSSTALLPERTKQPARELKQKARGARRGIAATHRRVVQRGR